MHNLTLHVLPEPLAICRLPADADLASIPATDDFWSVTRTPDELSVVLAESAVPDGWQHEGAWRCLKVVGPLEFSMVGVIDSLTTPLAAADVTVLTISTYDTDHVLVKAGDVERAAEVLRSAGHTVV